MLIFAPITGLLLSNFAIYYAILLFCPIPRDACYFAILVLYTLYHWTPAILLFGAILLLSFFPYHWILAILLLMLLFYPYHGTLAIAFYVYEKVIE